MAATLELAISAIRSGRTEEGRQLLNLLIQENPNNAKAWLWMSSVVNTDEQRARCLYHVLAIDPNSELARRGLNVLGIVVSDSRPVKIPRDSKPIQIPKPTPANQERRPFLIDPQAIADELPFTPVTAPFTEKVKASPAVLSIDVETENAGQSEDETSQDNEVQPQATQPESTDNPAEQPVETSEMSPPAPVEPEPQPQNPAQPVSIGASAETKDLETQPLPGQSQQRPSEPVPVAPADQTQGLALQPQNPSEPVPVPNVGQPGVAPQPQSNPAQLQSGTQMQNSGLSNTSSSPGSNAPPFGHQSQPMVDANQQSFGQPAPDVPIPNQTHPSQSMPVVGPNPNMGMSPGGQVPSYPMPPQGMAGHANVTMGMPTQQPQNPSQPLPPPIHSNTTMGMPLPAQNQQPQHPSEPVPVVSSSSQMGTSSYGQPQMPPQYYQDPALHSNSTMMMPTYPEVEARARFAASQPILATNSNFAYQSGMIGDPMVNAYGSMYHASRKSEEDDEEGVNILAVIIFGTLSVTALGGLGMLILLVFTTPPA